MKQFLVLISFLVTVQVVGQAKVWIRFGDAALQEGDNYAASRFYLKAWVEDSSYKDLVYKLGVAYKGYHNNSKAIDCFKNIEANPSLQLDNSDYLFHLAELYKSLGDYKTSKKYFEKYSRVNRDTRSYSYLKTKNELKNHSRVLSLLEDTTELEIKNLGSTINTGVAEYYPIWLNDSTILYSSLMAKDVSAEGVISDKHYSIKLYKGELKDSVWRRESVIEGASIKESSITDGSFDGQCDFYFSRKNKEGKYQIVKSRLIVEDSSSVFQMDSVKKIQFAEEDELYNFRNPFVVELGKKKYLLFSSDRPGGKGGMDIWYSEFKKGLWSLPKSLGTKVNSPGNEVGPNYDTKTNRFFFASDWHYGLGGFDIFEGNGSWRRPTSVTNMGIPINTKANDLYFAPLDSLKGMLTSSREGTHTDKDAVCCNDLYSYEYPEPKIDSNLLVITDYLSRDSVMSRLKRLVDEFHVTLYFHNDRPNPDNWDTITSLDYMQTYEGYLDSMSTYHIRNTLGKHGEDSIAGLNKINGFFDDYVHQGVEDLRVFTKELIKELDAGQKILLSVKGYASPLAKSNYNVNLTLRRINTLQNYLRRYPGGGYNKYLDETAENGGVLRIKKVPFGEYRSDTAVNDNYYNTRLSVYSKEASLERKIEIIKLELIEDSIPQDQFTVHLDSLETIFNIGLLDTNQFEWRFHLQNNSSDSLVITDTELSCHCLSTNRKEWKFNPGETEPLDVKFDLKGYKGRLGRRITLHMADGTKRFITLLMEIPK